MSSHRQFTCHSQTLSDTESHSIPLPCISSSDFSLLLSPIQPGSIRRRHQVPNNPLDRLLTHAFPCSKASLLRLALAVTRLQVATPFPPRARTNYVGVVVRSPHRVWSWGLSVVSLSLMQLQGVHGGPVGSFPWVMQGKRGF